MKSQIASASILAVGLITGGFLVGGRYEIVPSQANTVARLDRFTGNVEMCVVGADVSGCGWVLDGPPRLESSAGATPPPIISDNQMQELEDAGLARPVKSNDG